MRVKIFHENGQAYTLPVTQAVIYTDTGEPVACSYMEGDYVVHCDASHPDWERTVRRLGLRGE